LEYLTLIGTVTLIHLLAVISPGPDFVVAIRNSLTYSRKTGVWTAVGFGLGITIHVFYCIAGLGIIISKSIIIFNVIKYLGAAYLIYIGIKSFIAKSSHIDIQNNIHKNDISILSAIKMGFLTNVLNPKATLFFLSLFTLVINPETPLNIQVLLGVVMVVNTTLWFSLVAIFFTQKKIQNLFYKFQKVFNRVFGGLLIALGLKIVFTSS